ncbi:MAG: sulfotransferase family protein [Phycisphaerales bacterium JB040]
MRLPDFLIIGAMKSGTTTLYHDLRAHPGVFIPVDKEIHALVSDGVETQHGRAEYAAHFQPAPTGARCGDASTGYTKRPTHDGVAERARRVLGPGTDLIYIVREPISRALSHHYHALSWGETVPDPDEALAQDPAFTDYSRYAYQLEPWIETFGTDRLRVVKFEDYTRDRRAGADELFRFLGLDPAHASPDTDKIHNRGDTRAVHRGVFTAINRAGWYRRGLRRVIPQHFRQTLYRWFLPKAPPRPSPPSRATLERLRDVLIEDQAHLRRLLGDGAPAWDLDAAIDSILAPRRDSAGDEPVSSPRGVTA